MRNKSVIYLLVVLLPVGSCTIFEPHRGVPSALQALQQRIYEAEDARLLDGLVVVDDATASGGKFVQMKDSGSVVFDVDVEQEGQYELCIGYRAPDADKAQRILINEKEYAPEMGFLISPVWTESGKFAGLRSGVNTVELKKSWGNMDIDYLAVLGPLKRRPEITPVQNTVYKLPTAPGVCIQLDKNGNELTSLTLNGDDVPYKVEDVDYIQDSMLIKIPHDYLAALPVGTYGLVFHFKEGKHLTHALEVRKEKKDAAWTIVSLDVSHGTSVLILLPTHKAMLIDTGTEDMCRKRVIPFLDRHHISLNYLWITHYDDDHCGGQHLIHDRDKDIVIKDYNDYQAGDNFEFEKLKVTILNASADGEDENEKSLSFRMEYHGFVYIHGGDIYGSNQERILRVYKSQHRLNALRAHVYHANHHWHGSVDTEYLRLTDPYIFIVSAEEHVYGRGAYTQAVQQEVLPYLKKNHKRLIEDLLHCEVGHVVVRIADASHWSYETYKDLDAVIPFLVDY